VQRFNQIKNREYYYCTKKERNWETEVRNSVSGLGDNVSATNKTNDALIRVQDERWKRGRHCEMTRSLNIPITDEVVWDTVKDVVVNSNILKEKMKTEMLADKDKHDEEIKGKIRTASDYEKRLVKEIESISSAIAKIETDKVLEKIDNEQFEKIILNLENEITKQKSMLENTRTSINELNNRKNWIDWVSKFKETYEDVDKLKNEDKKLYLKGVVDKIDVHFDNQTNNHTLRIRFHFPIVDDEYKVTDKGGKRRKYEVLEGELVKEITQSFAHKFNNKKKAVVRTSFAEQSVTVE